MYYILNSSKGISSVFLGRLICVKQNTAWEMGHAIRLMMDSWAKELPLLSGTIEIDETFFGEIHVSIMASDTKTADGNQSPPWNNLNLFCHSHVVHSFDGREVGQDK